MVTEERVSVHIISETCRLRTNPEEATTLFALNLHMVSLKKTVIVKFVKIVNEKPGVLSWVNIEPLEDTGHTSAEVGSQK